MRTSKVFVIVLAAIVAAGSVFYACKKDRNELSDGSKAAMAMGSYSQPTQNITIQTNIHVPTGTPPVCPVTGNAVVGGYNGLIYSCNLSWTMAVGTYTGYEMAFEAVLKPGLDGTAVGLTNGMSNYDITINGQEITETSGYTETVDGDVFMIDHEAIVGMWNRVVEYVVDNVTIIHFAYDIPFIENPHPIEEYLFNPDDIDDENIDRQLYEIGLRVRHLFKNTHLNHYIMEKAGQNINKCIDLRTFNSWAPLATGGYSAEIISEIQTIIEATNLQYISKNPEVAGQVEHYIPALFVVNIKNANPNKMPIFSPGISVNEDLPGMEMYEDYIVVWYYDPAVNGFVEGLMSEEMAMTTTHPLIVVDNASPKMTKPQKGGGDDKETCTSTAPPPTQNMKNARYRSYEYQINTRCEKTGKSEFCIDAALIDENGGGGYVVTEYDKPKHLHHLIAKVAKKDIGKSLSKWFGFCTITDVNLPDYVPFECNYLFWNTFERDWARSYKSLGKATANGKTIYLAGEMKYDSDWFAYNPIVVQNNPFDFASTFNDGYKTYQNPATKLTIHREGNGPAPIYTGGRR